MRKLTQFLAFGFRINNNKLHLVQKSGLQSHAIPSSNHFQYQKSIHNFSTNKPNNPNQNPSKPQKSDKDQQPNNNQSKSEPKIESQTRKQSEQQNTQQTNLTKEQLFNLSIGLNRKHNFKTQLVVAQDQYKKSKKQLRQAILFEDLLKSQINILIYDTQGKPYAHHVVRIFLMIVSVVGTLYSFQQALKMDKKLKVSIEKTDAGKMFSFTVKSLCVLLILIVIKKHLKFTKRYVESITYNTEDETFTFLRRKIYGVKYNQKISRFKILYTENPALVNRGTNYINIENQNQYKIGYTMAWKKEDLFSHLISQRIRT